MSRPLGKKQAMANEAWLSLPPIYGWKKGYLCGIHPWPARVENGWREVFNIDPTIVEAAAAQIDSARHFLGGDEQ